MKKLLFIAMACYGLNASAQVRESKDFLYLYSDSVIYAGEIKFRPDFSGYYQFKVDSRNYPKGQVKFFNSRDGFFANTRKLGILNSDEFAERIIEGKINVFQERSFTRAYHGYHMGDRGSMQKANPIAVNMYYNKGYTDLKRLNYVNLKRDMADNPKAMDMLRAYKRKKNTTFMLYVAGAATFLTGAMLMMSEDKDPFSMSMANFTTGAVLAGAGLGIGAGGYLNSLSANRRLEVAVDNYNR